MKLSELIKEQDIVLGMQADRKRSALAAVAAKLGMSTGKGQGVVLNALLRRERLGSTAVGHGVAIPHAHLDDISAPAAVVASLELPVSFDSPDDDPVDLIVSLVWPTSDRDSFVSALARFCRLLRQPGLRHRHRHRHRSAPSPSAALAAVQSFEERTGGMARVGLISLCPLASSFDKALPIADMAGMVLNVAIAPILTGSRKPG